MKTVAHVLMGPKGVGIQLISETEIEFAVLEDLWKKGELTCGNGDSNADGGFKKGFYISYPNDPPKRASDADRMCM